MGQYHTRDIVSLAQQLATEAKIGSAIRGFQASLPPESTYFVEFTHLASRFESYRRQANMGIDDRQELHRIIFSFLSTIDVIREKHPKDFYLKSTKFTQRHLKSIRAKQNSTSNQPFLKRLFNKLNKKFKVKKSKSARALDIRIAGLIALATIIIMLFNILKERSSKPPHYVLLFASYEDIGKALTDQQSYPNREIIILDANEKYYLINNTFSGSRIEAERYLDRSKNILKKWHEASVVDVFDYCYDFPVNTGIRNTIECDSW